MSYIPIVIEQSGHMERAYDIYSRLLKDRIIFVTGGINDQVADTIIAQLLHLESQNPEKEIQMYINSPGGIITSGLAIHDTMKYIQAPVRTICMGQAASLASFLLASGTPGMRMSLPNSRIMIHQPLGGAEGQASDIAIQANEIMYLRDLLYGLLAASSGLTKERLTEMCDRNFWMSPVEAKEYGFIDTILEKLKK